MSDTLFQFRDKDKVDGEKGGVSTADKAQKEAKKGEDGFASKLSSSIVSDTLFQFRDGDKASGEKGGVSTADKDRSQKEAKEEGDYFASKLSSSIVSDTLFQFSTEKRAVSGREKGGAPPTAPHFPEVLAQSIISDVLSQSTATPNTPSSPPQTAGQPSGPTHPQTVQLYADNLATGIVSSLMQRSEQPRIVVERDGESVPTPSAGSSSSRQRTASGFLEEVVGGIVSQAVQSVAQPGRAGPPSSPQPTPGERDAPSRRETESSSGGRARSPGLEVSAGPERGRLREGDREGKMAVRHPPAHGSRAESPLRPGRPGLLRHALTHKHPSVSSEADPCEPDSAHHLSAPSGRISYAWSTASTRDDESRPVSPTDLDEIALSFVRDVDEFFSLFAELIIRSAIAEVTGNKKVRIYIIIIPMYMYFLCNYNFCARAHTHTHTHTHTQYICHVPTRSQANSAGDVQVPVPVIGRLAPPTMYVLDGKK